MVRTAVLLFVIVTVTGLPAVAQQSAFGFGLKGGLNLGDVELKHELEGDAQESYRYGLAAGAVLSLFVNPALSLDTDILYMQKGHTWEYEYREGSDPGGTRGWSYTSKTDYVVVAPMLRITFRGRNLSPYVIAGPEFGFLLDARMERQDKDDGEVRDTSEEDTQDAFADTDWGVAFGGGFEFPTGGAAVFLEGRYSLGMADINEGGSDNGGSQKNRGIYLLGGLRF